VHEHEFDGSPDKGHLACCVDRKCTEWRVGTGTAWRELTTTEHTNLTIHLWEDLVYADVARIIHGDHWRDWFEKVRGHR
jgi:hypothetical protein